MLELSDVTLFMFLLVRVSKFKVNYCIFYTNIFDVFASGEGEGISE
jgi:hypothetical protein